MWKDIHKNCLRILQEEINNKTLYRVCPDCKKNYKKENSLYVVRLEAILSAIQCEYQNALQFKWKEVKREKAYFRLADNVQKQLDLFLDWAENMKI